MEKKRITYFDALKGLAIMLVVFCHHVVLDGYSILGNVVMSFAWVAVPCFFMVTGGLLHKSREFSWKKWVERILKVYLCLCIWKFGYLIFYGIISDLEINGIVIIKYLFFLENMNGVDTGPMWFITAYLQALLVLPITYQLYREENKKGLKYALAIFGTCSIVQTLVSFLGIEILNSLLENIPFSGYTNMLFYFVLGALLLYYREVISEFFNAKKIRKYIPFVLACVGIIGLMLVKHSYTGSFRWHGVYISDGYSIVSTLVMSMGVYLVFSLDLIPEKCNSLLSELGKHTMGIFYLHYPVMVTLRLICEKLIDNFAQYYSFALNVLQTVVVVAICCAITIVAKKIPIIKNLFA